MTVEYDGMKWHLQKDGYYECMVDGKSLLLHKYVYENEKGKISKDNVIHHKDFDKSNNKSNNLQSLSRSEHSKIHSKGVSPWPKDDKGKEKHRKSIISGLKKLDKIEKVCENCGSTYKVRPDGHSHFCSPKCKVAHRRKSGVDNVSRVCTACGKTFTINKYTKTETCSRSCANVIRGRTLKNAVC